VANKIASPADEEYIRAALPGRDIVGVIPWSEEIRAAERKGRPVLDRPGKGLLGCFEGILRKLADGNSVQSGKCKSQQGNN
jgi:hypothetical protein